MAAHQQIEAEHSDAFEVIASAPMAGPYDLSKTMLGVILDDKAHPRPFTLPYLMLAYNRIYGLFATDAEIFASPYDTTVLPLFDGKHSAEAINEVMPQRPLDVFAPALVNALRNDAGHPVHQALRDNDVYDWAPSAPIRLYHCKADTRVSLGNVQVALKALKQRGARVEQVDIAPAAGHDECAVPSFVDALQWFETFSTAR